MNLMLFSNGKTKRNSELLEFGSDWIQQMVRKTQSKKFLFVPYAMIRGEYTERTTALNVVFSRFGCEVIGLHQVNDPIAEISSCDGIIVSGGNTWVLNKTLHEMGLIGPLREAVIEQNKLYIGWSAGTNIAAPTIRTTNDMPIATSAILSSLNFVPFQINPHYLEANDSGHMGETRDERIEEFLLTNPHECVVAIPEGTMLKLTDGELTYHATENRNMKLFRYGLVPQEFCDGDNLTNLLEHIPK